MSDTKAAEVKLFKATIDGIEIEVPAGTNIIQAAQKIGKFVPHFCYHPGLSVVGQCRMCFVEVEGVPKLQTACSTMVGDNMKILTESPKVKAGQNGTLEFTLLNHPLDCPICDRGGECKLQDFTYEFGPPLSRMADEKELRQKHRPISDEIILDQERCIICTRCVRFSSEVDGRAELAVNQRGHWNVIDVFEDTPMKSVFSGNVVDLCPVGALTAKDFRFVARPWELKRHDAICTGCSSGCNVEIHTKNRGPGIPRPDGKAPTPEIKRLVPRENSEVNTWWMCDNGRWGYHFHNEIENRLDSILIKRSKTDAQVATTLKEAQVLLDQNDKGSWEFWIDDAASHETIAWAKDLQKSWTSRGRQVAALNPSAFGKDFLQLWASKSSSPWFAGATDFKNIKKVICPVDDRGLEGISPMVSLRLGQQVRKGLLQWEIFEPGKDYSKEDLATTAFLLKVPKSSGDLKVLRELPAAAKLLILWTRTNSRGLLNEGIAPVELLEQDLRDKRPAGPVFLFSQTTQRPTAGNLADYVSQAPFLVLSDSFKSPLSERAHIVLPVTPLYESEATLTNLENRRQLSRGVHIHHPNYPSLHRGGPAVNPALRLI